MLACTFDPALGGRSIDIAIAHQLAQGFNKPGSDVTKNKRSWIRLLAEVWKYITIIRACQISNITFNIFRLINWNVKCLRTSLPFLLTSNAWSMKEISLQRWKGKYKLKYFFDVSSSRFMWIFLDPTWKSFAPLSSNELKKHCDDVLPNRDWNRKIFLRLNLLVARLVSQLSNH